MQVHAADIFFSNPFRKLSKYVFDFTWEVQSDYWTSLLLVSEKKLWSSESFGEHYETCNFYPVSRIQVRILDVLAGQILVLVSESYLIWLVLQLVKNLLTVVAERMCCQGLISAW